MDELLEYIYDGDLTAEKLDDVIRSNISYIEGPEGEALGGGAATASVLKRLGFDGVIDNTVDVKFGSSRAIGQMMEGVYPDTQHIITFPGSEHTIRSVNAKFNPKDWKSTDILAGTAAAAIGAGALLKDSEEPYR